MAQLRLMGAHEIRVRLGGISRQRVYQLTSRENFPAPAAHLQAGKVWLADDVEAWSKYVGRIRVTRRKPGSASRYALSRSGYSSAAQSVFERRKSAPRR